MTILNIIVWVGLIRWRWMLHDGGNNDAGVNEQPDFHEKKCFMMLLERRTETEGVKIRFFYVEGENVKAWEKLVVENVDMNSV